VHHLFVTNWESAIQLLLQKADSIIVYGGKSGRSMEFELSEIIRIGKEENTVIISRPSSPIYDRIPEADHTRLKQMLGYDGDFEDLGGSDESLEAFDNRRGYIASEIDIKRLVKEWILTSIAQNERSGDSRVVPG